MEQNIDIASLIEWLGSDGARSGLRNSKRLTLSELIKIADSLQVKHKSKIRRNELIDLLILQFDRRIDKSFSELKSMNAADLSEYLDKTGCSKEEVIDLLDQHNIPYKKSDTRASLIRHAADQISGWGIFERIAGEDS